MQLKRLLKRRKVQECLEETEKEMGATGMSLNDLEALLSEEGIVTKIESLPTRRIASNENMRFLFIKNMKEALVEAKKHKSKEENEAVSEAGPSNENTSEIPVSNQETEIKTDLVSSCSKDELEDDLQKAIAMSLECSDDRTAPVTNTSKTDDSWTSFVTDSDYSNSDNDSAEADGYDHIDMSSAKAYIMQYSDYTHKAIEKIIDKKKTRVKKRIVPQVDDILQDLNNEKTIITDKVDLSSDEDDPSNVEVKIKNEISSDSDCFELEQISEEKEPSIDHVQEEKLEPSVISINDSNESLDTNKEDSKRYPEIETIGSLSSESVQEKKATCPEIKSQSESSESDEDFEEVTDEKCSSTPIVEFSLRLGEAPVDDIFADVFEERQYDQLAKPNTKSNTVKIEKKSEDLCSSKTNYVHLNDKPGHVDTDSTTLVSETDLDLGAITSIDKIKSSNLSPGQKFAKIKSHTDSPLECIDKTSKIVQNQTSTTRTDPAINEITDTSKEIAITKATDKPKDPISREQLNTMVEEMQTEEQNLIQEKGRLDRIGRNITEQMTKEAQELLQIFGIPYIVAPMEAEAQCAFLESVNLTDGTITDDSDIWLFGGRTVYKNFFNQKKHVLQFLSERIEKSYSEFVCPLNLAVYALDKSVQLGPAIASVSLKFGQPLRRHRLSVLRRCN